jgi:hypothetical protein
MPRCRGQATSAQAEGAPTPRQCCPQDSLRPHHCAPIVKCLRCDSPDILRWVMYGDPVHHRRALERVAASPLLLGRHLKKPSKSGSGAKVHLRFSLPTSLMSSSRQAASSCCTRLATLSAYMRSASRHPVHLAYMRGASRHPVHLAYMRGASRHPVHSIAVRRVTSGLFRLTLIMVNVNVCHE